MGLDIVKKLRGDAERRRQAKAPERARPKYAPAHGIFVSQNWSSLLERKPSVAPKAAAAEDSAGLGSNGGAAPNVVAIDCEMVGVGAGGTRSVLARVSVVDFEGAVLLDRLVLPQERVTDYRSHITGITAATLRGKNVISEAAARQKTAEVLEGKVVVGHSLQNDFQALMLSHPHEHIRDTALYRPLRPPGRENRTPSLAGLVEHWFREKIHQGQHDSIEDARMALRLYRLKSRAWEKQMRSAMRRAPASLREHGGAGEDEGERVERAPVEAAAPRQEPQRERAEERRKRKAAGSDGAGGGPAAAVDKAKNPGKKKRAREAAKQARLAPLGAGGAAGRRRKKKRRQDA